MKKHIFLLLAGFTFSAAQSQDISDALRYAQDNLNGTARFRAMGGAFGALGGDLSAININPAGSAVFSNHQTAITLTNFNTHNDSNYFGTKTTDSDNAFDMNQLGAVFVFKNQNPNAEWKKFSFSINYENTNNFDNSVFSAGVNPTNSIDRYFLHYANGVPLGLIKDSFYAELDNGAQQAYLGYHTYIINSTNESNLDNTNYVSNVTPGGNYYQENSIYTNGYNGKLSFNASTSYKDKLYIGINLNSHFTDYYRSTSFYERNNNPLTGDYTVKRLNFENDLYTYGSGFSFQLGAIAKVTNEIRLGIAYESPTWYHLSDEFSQRVTAVRANTSDELTAIEDPAVINYYSPYDVQTPDKWNFSFAYVFGKNGLISIDYGLKNYQKTKFEPDNDIYYRGLNSQMDNILECTASEIRVGGEYKIKALSLRGGYRFDGSPYKDGKTIGDLNSFSGGLGYNFGIFKMDLAYTHAERNSQQPFFSQGFTDGAKINTKNNNVSMTLAFEL